MKNIHIIPTDKPSRLIHNTLGYAMVTNEFTQSDLDLIQATFVNIYITSDEKIKEGDWVYHTILKSVFKINLKEVSQEYLDEKKHILKVVLTTDQDLIKDGVQAIDDEFLEWFVNNPSCERVEIEDWHNKFLSCCRSKEECYCNKKRIIIPQEGTFINP